MLTGGQLMHLGDLYGLSWRANYIKWGRLDAAGRLTAIALDPTRLRQWAYRQMQEPDGESVARDALMAAATETANEHLTQELVEEWKTKTAQGSRLCAEIDAIFDTSRTTPLDGVPELAAAITRRRQLEIAEQELPLLVEELEYDQDEGAILSADAKRFMRRVEENFDGAEAKSLQGLVDTFRVCRVGEEKLVDESRSDRFGRITGQATAVGTSLTQSTVPFRTGRALLRGIRGIGVLSHFLTDVSAGDTRGQSWGKFLWLVALAVGGVSYAATFITGSTGVVSSLFAIVALAGPIAVFARRNSWTALPWMLGAFLLPVLAWNFDDVIDGWRPRGDGFLRSVVRGVLEMIDNGQVGFTLLAAALSFTLLGFIGARPQPKAATRTGGSSKAQAHR